MSSAPAISHVLETCLYVRDVAASVEFYKRVFGLTPFMDTSRMAGFSLGSTTLLLFQLGQTVKDVNPPAGGCIPAHGPSKSILELLNPEGVKLGQHFCLAVNEPGDVEKYAERFRELEVRVTGRMEWEKGGRSVYFEDPDGHVGEVASRGIWPHY